MSNIRKLACYRCNNVYSVGKIRYIKVNDRVVLMCNGCVTNVENNRFKTAKKQELKAVIKKYICGRCRFKFKFDFTKFNRSNLRCPYCGKNDKILEEKISSARDILTEVSSSDFDEISVMRKF